MPLPLTEQYTPQSLRFAQLRQFARGIGACWSCSTWLAMKQVDREFGLVVPPADPLCANENKCTDVARAAWKDIPKFEVTRAA